MWRKLVLPAILISSWLSSQALACGDSQYQVGSGMFYRVYTAPLPGNVLVYGHSANAQMLAAGLESSGHGVSFVDNPADFSSAIGSGDYDVIIAPYSERSDIGVDVSATSATFIPVASADEARAAKAAHSRVMISGRDELKHYLKAIHLTLKEKS